MPEQPDELRILVPESRRADRRRRSTRRQALVAGGGARWPPTSPAAAARPASSGGGGGGERCEPATKPPTPADGKVEQGDLLLANWVDYSDPNNYKGYQKENGPKIKVSGYGSNDELLAKLRAGGSKYDIVAPTGYAVKTMIDQGLAMPLTHELIPNLKNLEPAFTKTEYDPGNKYSVPKDYGITSFYWLTDKVSEKPTTIKECFDLLKTPKFKSLNVNFLEGGTQVMALALKALGYSTQHRGPEGDRRGQAAADRRQAEHRHDQLDLHRARRRAARSTSAWAGTATSAARSWRWRRRTARWSSSCPRARREYWVDNWVIPPTPSTPSPRTSGSTTCSTRSTPARR